MVRNEHTENLMKQLETDATLGSWWFKDENGEVAIPHVNDKVFTLVFANHEWWIESYVVLSEPFTTHKWFADTDHILKIVDKYQKGQKDGDSQLAITVSIENDRDYILSYHTKGFYTKDRQPSANHFLSMGVGRDVYTTRIGFKTYEAAFSFWAMVYGSAVLNGWLDQVIERSIKDDEIEGVSFRNQSSMSYAPKLEKHLTADYVSHIEYKIRRVYSGQPVYEQAVDKELAIYQL